MTPHPSTPGPSSTVLLLGATLAQMGCVLRQLRAGLPPTRAALRVIRFLEALRSSPDLTPQLRQTFAELAEVWEDWSVPSRPRPHELPAAPRLGPPDQPPQARRRPELRLVQSSDAASARRGRHERSRQPPAAP
jgi:hypothetical protein